MKSRIAPTPSGFLHLGNAANFLLTAAIVKEATGELLLRIDDLDAGRMRPAYLDHIFSTLAQLNITVTQGPTDATDFLAHWSQRIRLPLYQEALDRLRNQGVLYACDCSRKKVAELYPDGTYRGYCRTRKLSLDTKGVAWRLAVPNQLSIQLPEQLQPRLATVNLAAQMGDLVIRKKDGVPAYQMASLLDDGYFEVSHIIRGEDLLASSAAQVYLAQLLGETNFLRNLKTYHHPLLTDQYGVKLSKSAGALAIEQGEKGKLDLTSIRTQIEHWLEGSGLPNKNRIIRLVLDDFAA